VYEHKGNYQFNTGGIKMQKIISGANAHKEIENILKSLKSKKYMLVCDSAFEFLEIKDYFKGLDIPKVVFSDFTVNPLYQDVCKGVELFNSEKCDTIVAVGGGSTIDVAKCIKLFCKMDNTQNYLEQEFKDTGIPLIALPTTAGTGSESTRYAVIYYKGEKQSITSQSIIPDFAVLEPSVLKTLPIYQKKCTLLDAFCQAIESWWSVNSNDESREYSKIAVESIVKNYKEYLADPTDDILSEIMTASNYAGRAINITATTSAHAMSYKMTSVYGIPHGHAVAIGLPHIWEYMIANPQNCIDSRGEEYLLKTFNDIAVSMGCSDATQAVARFKELLKELEIEGPKATKEELDLLTASVNVGRLKNNPVALSKEVLYDLYLKITQR
jgi:alcohol dehydrogenase class IV